MNTINITKKVSTLTTWQIEKSKERIAELGETMIDAGSGGAVPLEVVGDNLKDIVLDSEDAVKTFKDIQKEAEDLGLDAEALATAYAGGADAIESQVKAVDAVTRETKALADRERELYGRSSEATGERLDGLEAQKEALLKVQAETDTTATGSKPEALL